MTTTAAAIRDAMLTLVEALTPTLASETRFERHREAMDFRAWAEENPSACFRRFSIRYQGNSTPTPVGNTQVEETSHTFEVTIAYPNSARLGHPQLLELDDVVDADQTKVHATIGPPGYASLTAPATVLHEENWSREVAGPVLFAVIRYRVDFYRATGATSAICQVVGLNDVVYEAGDVITGAANLRALYLTNGVAKVTYEAPVPSGQDGVHHLYIRDAAGNWDRILSQQYGDYFYFVQTQATADSATVIEATDDAVEVVFQWDAHDISAANLVQYTHGALAIYPESSATTRKHSTVLLRKRIRLERGTPGYFVGVDSEPLVTPGSSVVQIAAQENNWGEQECGLGTGQAVTFSSASVTVRHPAAGVGQHDLGIVAQTTGPWWFASIPADTDIPYARFVIIRGRRDSKAYQFGAGDNGVAVVRHMFPVFGPTGAYAHQIFIGATPYTADSSGSFANEPTAIIQSTVATIAADLDWPAT